MPSDVIVLNASEGSVIVSFSVDSKGIEDLDCAIQAGVSNGELIEQLYAYGNELYDTVNVENGDCGLCECNAVPILRCPPLYHFINASSCMAPSWCAFGSVFRVCDDAANISVRTCPADGRLIATECFVDATVQCAAGRVLQQGPGATCTLTCPNSTVSTYFKQPGVCLRAISCGPGMFVDPSAPIRQLCANSSVCNGSPCKNGGTCTATGLSSYSCECAAGFSGSNCSEVNNCEGANACLNGGACQPSKASFVCICAHGYQGGFCELALQASSSAGGISVSIIGGAIAAVVVIALVVLLLLWRLRHRTARKTDSRPFGSSRFVDYSLFYFISFFVFLTNVI
jgi:hypothetical protein